MNSYAKIVYIFVTCVESIKATLLQSSHEHHSLTSLRMEMSMLTELNKDYLKELDITMMGDIIIILRHAKKVAERNASNKVLEEKEWKLNHTEVILYFVLFVFCFSFTFLC